jgi:hypothetical protein
MGFSDVQARQALSANGHIIEASINWSFNVSFRPFAVPKLILCPLFDTCFCRLSEQLAASSASAGTEEDPDLDAAIAGSGHLLSTRRCAYMLPHVLLIV